MAAAMATAAPAKRAPASFKILSSRNSFPLDCHFETPELSGRVRLDNLGGAQILISDENKAVHECNLEVGAVTYASALVVPAAVLYFGPLADCQPAMATSTGAKLARRMRLVLFREEVKIFAQSAEESSECKIIRFERAELIRTVKRLTEKTGTGKGAERAISPGR